MSLIYPFQRSVMALLLVLGSVSSYAQTCNDRVLQTTPDDHYEISNDGTEVVVEKTGLIWQRCSVGQHWDGSSCSGSVTSHTWSGALALADEQWRLPNIKELKSLVEEACYAPAINASVFPGTIDSYYWSSSPSADSSSNAWNVGFYNGYAYANDKDNNRYVRLVRGGQ